MSLELYDNEESDIDMILDWDEEEDEEDYVEFILDFDDECDNFE